MLQDVCHRPARDLRISVTDRCNFRCSYCMPLAHYEWIDRKEILSFEEITRLARLFVSLGVQKIRITGGEPLLRHGLHELVAQIAHLEGLQDLCMTTNGSLLVESSAALAAAGLHRINVSLDALDPDVFRNMTGRDDLPKVRQGLFVAKACGLNPIKINAVVVRGVNTSQILNLVDFCRAHGFSLRFIEYMDAGNANQWNTQKLVSKHEILEIIRTQFALRETGREYSSSPEVLYQFTDGVGDLGVIASVTEPFCSACARVRLTADGRMVTCLFSENGHDLKGLLRRGASDDELMAFIRNVWTQRTDRYSEERLTALKSQQGYEARERTKIEMIKLGG
jgi:GTP 3',8-cyclase